MSEFLLVTCTNIVTLLGTILIPYFTVITRIPAWAEVADDEDYIPVPTFQSAFTEALGAADWTISSGTKSAGQGKKFDPNLSLSIYLCSVNAFLVVKRLGFSAVLGSITHQSLGKWARSPPPPPSLQPNVSPGEKQRPESGKWRKSRLCWSGGITRRHLEKWARSLAPSPLQPNVSPGEKQIPDSGKRWKSRLYRGQ